MTPVERRNPKMPTESQNFSTNQFLHHFDFWSLKEFQIVKYLFVIFYFWVVIFFEEGDLTAGVHTSSIEDCAYAWSAISNSFHYLVSIRFII